MKLLPVQHRTFPRAHDRGGLMVTEVLVAAIVLLLVVSVITQLAVRSGRVRLENRQYQTAIDELSNQLDVLLAMAPGDRDAAMADLQVSATARQALASPQLTADLVDDDQGRRIVVELTWRRYAQRRPVTLVGWLPPEGNPGSEGATP